MCESITLKTLLEFGSNSLQHSSPSPEVDSQYLLAHLLQKEVSYLYTWPTKVIEVQICESFYHLIEKRKTGWPIAYLLGKKAFWSFDLMVNESTLIPRPETEHLVELALERLDVDGAHQVADLGTGSGAIGLAIAKERPHSSVFATDISQSALEMAACNADRLGISNIQFSEGNWYQALPENKRYNLVVSNPPYVARDEVGYLSSDVYFEPSAALFSEESGLKDMRLIVQQAPNYLENGGWLLVEHGFLQAEKVRFLFEKAGFKGIFTHKDYAKHERVTGGRL